MGRLLAENKSDCITFATRLNWLRKEIQERLSKLPTPTGSVRYPVEMIIPADTLESLMPPQQQRVMQAIRHGIDLRMVVNPKKVASDRTVIRLVLARMIKFSYPKGMKKKLVGYKINSRKIQPLPGVYLWVPKWYVQKHNLRVVENPFTSKVHRNNKARRKKLGVRTNNCPSEL